MSRNRDFEEGMMESMIDMEKAKYARKWRGPDGKWRYSYTNPSSSGVHTGASVGGSLGDILTDAKDYESGKNAGPGGDIGLQAQAEDLVLDFGKKRAMKMITEKMGKYPKTQKKLLGFMQGTDEKQRSSDNRERVSGKATSSKVSLEAFEVLDDPSSESSKSDIRNAVKKHGQDAVVKYLSSYVSRTPTFKDEGWDKTAVSKLVARSLKKSRGYYPESSNIALVVIPGSLAKSSHSQHPAGISQPNTKTKSNIPYTGHGERMKLAKMAAARMLGTSGPETAKEYADNSVVDRKGREKGQKAPYGNYSTGVSGMGSQSHDIYAKQTYVVKPSELGSSAPESASKYAPARHTPTPKR